MGYPYRLVYVMSCDRKSKKGKIVEKQNGATKIDKIDEMYKNRGIIP